MTHCDFSARSARDEMRQIIGRSEPDVIIGSHKDQNRGCRQKDKDHIEFLCELYDAQVARGRCFVRELTSEVNSRMKCVAKIMAMPGTSTAVADLCMFGKQVSEFHPSLSLSLSSPSLLSCRMFCLFDFLSLFLPSVTLAKYSISRVRC